MQWQSDPNSICISTLVPTPLILSLHMFFSTLFKPSPAKSATLKINFLVPPFTSSDVKHPADKEHTFAPCLCIEREEHANHLFFLLNAAGSSNMAYKRTQRHQKGPPNKQWAWVWKKTWRCAHYQDPIESVPRINFRPWSFHLTPHL